MIKSLMLKFEIKFEGKYPCLIIDSFYFLVTKNRVEIV